MYNERLECANAECQNELDAVKCVAAEAEQRCMQSEHQAQKLQSNVHIFEWS